MPNLSKYAWYSSLVTYSVTSFVAFSVVVSTFEPFAGTLNVYVAFVDKSLYVAVAVKTTSTSYLPRLTVALASSTTTYSLFEDHSIFESGKLSTAVFNAKSPVTFKSKSIAFKAATSLSKFSILGINWVPTGCHLVHL